MIVLTELSSQSEICRDVPADPRILGVLLLSAGRTNKRSWYGSFLMVVSLGLTEGGLG